MFLVDTDHFGHQHTIDRRTGKVGVFDGDVFEIDVYEIGVAKIDIGKRRSLHIHVVKTAKWSVGVIDFHTGKVGVFDNHVTQIDVYETGVAKIDIGKCRSLRIHIVKARLSQVRIAYEKRLTAIYYFHRSPSPKWQNFLSLPSSLFQAPQGRKARGVRLSTMPGCQRHVT